MDLVYTLAELVITLVIFSILNFTVSIILKRNDIADVAWGLGFIIVCVYLWLQVPATPTALAVYVMVIVWGLRLSVHIGIRNSKKSEDFRYKQWREEWGNKFFLRSFLQVYLLQMGILLVVSLPIIFAALYTTSKSLHLVQWGAIILWLIGFMWQAIADYQLSQFKKKQTGTIMKTGLWKYSRHPNYFGEIVMWWSLFLFVLPAIDSYYPIISPILITFLLLKVSGVPMLEEKYKDNREFQEYKRKTPAVFPFIS